MMRKIKTLGLAVGATLALSAMFGSAAQAEPGALTAEQFPASSGGVCRLEARRHTGRSGQSRHIPAHIFQLRRATRRTAGDSHNQRMPLQGGIHAAGHDRIG